MEPKLTLRMDFADAQNNKTSITVTNPKNDISSADVKDVTGKIVDNSLVIGKMGPITKNLGNVLITKTEAEI